MIRKETRIINGREAHLYYDEERQAYLVASDLMEVFLGLYENADKLANQLAEESNNGWIPCSERMPKDEELSQRKEIIVQNRYGEIFTAQYTYNSAHTRKDFFRDCCVVPCVIAWQPLPPRYEPKE